MRPTYDQIAERVLEISAEQFGYPEGKLQLTTRVVQDCHIDSLDLIEWMMEMEDEFEISLPEPDALPDQAYKELFTRIEFSLGDMVDMVQLRWGSGTPENRGFLKPSPPGKPVDAFTHLGGKQDVAPDEIYRRIGDTDGGAPLFRRLTDGITSLQLPGGVVEIGYDGAEAGRDERPKHRVELSPFLIDRETVSNTAYCRFLNSVDVRDDAVLAYWFAQDDDPRALHRGIELSEGAWRPRPGTADWPMVLVSWYGAQAYSLWANGHDWREWRSDAASFLPSEAQWEYAARGAASTRWPWGDADDGALNAGVHGRGDRYATAADLPMRPVTESSGVSPFGLVHMAGNVWQWCRDDYDPAAYAKRPGRLADPVVLGLQGAKVERGGSWVGPASLCRSSYRRARLPAVSGRCLGFRCVGAALASAASRGR